MDLLIKQARIEDGEELKDVGITAGKNRRDRTIHRNSCK